MDGIAMGSPLAPTLANLFMGTPEESYNKGPLFYKRYVNNIFCVSKNANQAKDYLNNLNKQHPNTSHIMEVDKMNK